MNCQEARRQLDAYADHELDLFRRIEIEQHIASCAECAATEKNLQTLKHAVTSNALYYRASAALRTRIQSLNLPSNSPRRPTQQRRSLIAASVVLLFGLASMLAILVTSATDRGDGRLAESVLASHIRSLQVDHATDVASTDQHTVKPWFRGKLNFAPQVPDLSQDGYDLSGGRLDYLVDRTVAALVYYRRLHPINVFTYPATNNEQQTVKRDTRQGYHIRHWQRDGMIHWVISDLNDQDLDEFVRRFQEQCAKPSNGTEAESSQ